MNYGTNIALYRTVPYNHVFLLFHTINFDRLLKNTGMFPNSKYKNFLSYGTGSIPQPV